VRSDGWWKAIRRPSGSQVCDESVTTLTSILSLAGRGRREATGEGRLRRVGGKRHEFRKHLLNHAAFRGLFLVISPDNAELTKQSDVYPQHECGLFGVFGHPNAAVLTYYGLFALQHRGQESAG